MASNGDGIDDDTLLPSARTSGPTRHTSNGDGIDDDTLLQVMRQLNPWWRTGVLPLHMRRPFKMRDYRVMVDHLDKWPVQGILGARQVGKTTMLYQLIEHLISSGADPKRVLFLTFDAHGLVPEAGNMLRMLKLYADGVLGESIYELGEKVHAILDEVHLVHNWQRVVKNFVDQSHPIKFVVSGSSSADIFAGSSESLAGRAWHQTMSTMSFAGYVEFKDPGYAEALAAAGLDMRRSLGESAAAGDARPFYESVRRASLGLAMAKGEMLLHLSEYLLYGGYPRAAGRTDRADKAETIRAHRDLALYKDVARVGGVRRPDVLDRLFYHLSWRSPRMISRDGMSSDLGVKKGTIDMYCSLLEHAFLVSYSDFYTPSPAIRHRRARKAYVNDVGMRNVTAYPAGPDEVDDPAETGMMAETVAGHHTRRLWRALAPASADVMPHYWHNGGRAEVDLVVRLRGGPVPIEVKYRRRVDKQDLAGLSRFSSRFDPPLSVAVSRDTADMIGDRTVVVPLWLYLLMG